MKRRAMSDGVQDQKHAFGLPSLFPTTTKWLFLFALSIHHCQRGNKHLEPQGRRWAMGEQEIPARKIGALESIVFVYWENAVIQPI